MAHVRVQTVASAIGERRWPLTRDWIGWHRGYDDAHSELSQRLDHVAAALRSAIDSAPMGPIRILSLCSGDARDLTRALGDHPRRPDVSGCAVEVDPTLAATAADDLASAGIDIAVRCGDAGDPHKWSNVLPVDVLLLAGIFGNIDDHDVHATIAAVPSICRLGGTIIWTRHRREPDLTPVIVSWFAEAGCVETSFASPGPSSYAVGSHRYLHPQEGRLLDSHIFRFVDDRS